MHDDAEIVRAARTGLAACALPGRIERLAADPLVIVDSSHTARSIATLVESLRDLDAGLRSLNSRLIVLDGAPEVALRAALADWSVDRLAYQLDLASAESKRPRASRWTAASVASSGRSPYEKKRAFDGW